MISGREKNGLQGHFPHLLFWTPTLLQIFLGDASWKSQSNSYFYRYKVTNCIGAETLFWYERNVILNGTFSVHFINQKKANDIIKDSTEHKYIHLLI